MQNEDLPRALYNRLTFVQFLASRLFLYIHKRMDGELELISFFQKKREYELLLKNNSIASHMIIRGIYRFFHLVLEYNSIKAPFTFHFKIKSNFLCFQLLYLSTNNHIREPSENINISKINGNKCLHAQVAFSTRMSHRQCVCPLRNGLYRKVSSPAHKFNQKSDPSGSRIHFTKYLVDRSVINAFLLLVIVSVLHHKSSPFKSTASCYRMPQPPPVPLLFGKISNKNSLYTIIHRNYGSCTCWMWWFERVRFVHIAAATVFTSPHSFVEITTAFISVHFTPFFSY